MNRKLFFELRSVIYWVAYLRSEWYMQTVAAEDYFQVTVSNYREGLSSSAIWRMTQTNK